MAETTKPKRGKVQQDRLSAARVIVLLDDLDILCEFAEQEGHTTLKASLERAYTTVDRFRI